MGEEDCSRELQLLSKPFSSPHHQWASITPMKKHYPSNHPSLDLKLSIGIGTCETPSKEAAKTNMKGIQALRWHTAEQIRLTTVEKAYAEHVRELTRREMEMAEEESARARIVWQRAREEVEKAERMKEMATQKVGPSCAEIICRACHQRFRS